MKLRLRDYVMLVIVLAVVAIIATRGAQAGERQGYRPAAGTDIRVKSNTNVNTKSTAVASSSNIMTTGDTNLAFDSTAYVMGSHSLGDVDINQCIVTHQKGSFVVSWQGYDYNLWCMGEVFDAKGLPQMGALMRCDIQEIRRHFGSDESCLSANTVVQHHNEQEQQALAAVQANLAVTTDRYDDELERVQMEQTMLYEQIEEQRILLAQAQRPVVVQAEPALSEDEKDAVWRALRGDKK